MSKIFHIRFPFVLVLALVLNACGGGDGGDGGNADEEILFKDVALTSNNAVAIARMALSDSGFTLQEYFSDENLPHSGMRIPVVLDGLLYQLKSFGALNDSIAEGEEKTCGGSGAIAKASDYSGVYTFTDCDDLDIYNGKITVSHNGSIYPEGYSGTLVFDNFTIIPWQNADLTITLNGSLTVYTYERGTTDEVRYSGTKLRFDFNSETVILSWFSMEYFRAQLIIARAYFGEVNYIMSSSVLGGSVHVEGGVNSDSGIVNGASLTITGLNGSSGPSAVRVDEFGTSGVSAGDGAWYVETDSDGDGVYESSQQIMWPGA